MFLFELEQIEDNEQTQDNEYINDMSDSDFMPPLIPIDSNEKNNNHANHTSNNNENTTEEMINKQKSLIKIM